MSLDPLYVLLRKVSVQVFCPFFNWVVCLPGVQSCEFFIYFGGQALETNIVMVMELWQTLAKLEENCPDPMVSQR